MALPKNAVTARKFSRLVPFLLSMTATIQLAAGSSPVVQARKGERRRVQIRALVRPAGSNRVDIDVVDLSVSGFRFESFHRFHPGMQVFLTIAGFAPLQAEIAWRDDTIYGCKLAAPLHRAVFEMLAARFG